MNEKLVTLDFATMPIENLADEGLAKNPDLDIAQWKFMLATEKYKNDPQVKNDMMTAITKDRKYLGVSISPSHT